MAVMIDDPVWDGLTITSMVVRILINVVMLSLCIVQFYYELRFQKRENLPNARLFTLFGLSAYPFLRTIYVCILFKTNDVSWGSLCDYFTVWTIYFEFFAWCWVGCHWSTLFLFTSNAVNMKQFDRMWRICTIISILGFLFLLSYCFIVRFNYPLAPSYFTIGFLTLLGLFGFICCFFGYLLTKQVKKKESSLNPKLVKTVKRIKIMASILVLTILCTLARDLIYFAVLGVPSNHPLRYLSNVFTMIFELVIGVVMMIAVADEPFNYLTFTLINPSLMKVSPSSTLKEPRGIFLGSQRRKNQTATSTTNSESVSSTNSISTTTNTMSMGSGVSSSSSISNQLSHSSTSINTAPSRSLNNSSVVSPPPASPPLSSSSTNSFPTSPSLLNIRKETRKSTRSIHLNVIGTTIDNNNNPNRNSVIITPSQPLPSSPPQCEVEIPHITLTQDNSSQAFV